MIIHTLEEGCGTCSLANIHSWPHSQCRWDRVLRLPSTSWKQRTRWPWSSLERNCRLLLQPPVCPCPPQCHPHKNNQPDCHLPEILHREGRGGGTMLISSSSPVYYVPWCLAPTYMTVSSWRVERAGSSLFSVLVHLSGRGRDVSDPLAENHFINIC